jgi:DNA-binding GntR family transcriptional regulator
MPGRQDIAATLRDRIRTGDYPIGSKMPSTREITGELGGSRATASAALHLLADEGYLSLKDKSTAVVVSPEAIGSTPEARLADARAELLALRDDVTEVQQRLDDVNERLANALDRLRP